MESRLSFARLNFFPRSLTQVQDTEYGLVHTVHGKRMAVLVVPGSAALDVFDGEISEFAKGILKLCPLTQRNAAALRNKIPWLNPKLLGLHTSVGMGDRLGMATPGHVRAIRSSAGKVMPIFAQQSIREMQRTGRTPQQVMDDAMWGIFEEGWQAGAGADADHLKTTEDINRCFAAGFTFFTLDPGQYVVGQAVIDDRDLLSQMLGELPDDLQPEASGLRGKTFNIEGDHIAFDEHVLLTAVVKYGQALKHIRTMYEYLQHLSGNHPAEVEISMDETTLPTSPAEHIYIASELQRCGVKWVSFAPRFVGKFEKGVDYLGDLGEFETQLGKHAAIAREFGPYKLSLHSGSDKFRIYSLFMHHTRGVAHIKTAGTSYLEALRTISACDPQLFHEIYHFAREHFEADKQSYHLSAQLNKAPGPGENLDGNALLDQFDARQILHTTFGSVLTEKMSNNQFLFYDRIVNVLNTNRNQYFENLEKHFRRHLEPFSIQDTTGRVSQ